MDEAPGLRGIWSATVTPVDAQLRPDATRAIAYYRDLLESGCDGVNVLGTTGEAMSFGVEQRLAFMASIANGDLPTTRVMAGTGAAALEDTVRLTQAALDLGFAGALLMPPFFSRDASDDGIVRFFEALLDRVPTPRKRLLLYNFPAMSGITFRPALVDRLVADFPEAIGGFKDSSNDRDLQASILARHPDLAVFPSSEQSLLDALGYGAAGCISGSVALWGRQAQSAYRNRSPESACVLAERRMALRGIPLVAAARCCIALQRRDDAWERTMPPLVPLTAEQRTQLLRRFEALDLRF